MFKKRQDIHKKGKKYSSATIGKMENINLIRLLLIFNNFECNILLLVMMICLPREKILIMLACHNRGHHPHLFNDVVIIVSNQPRKYHWMSKRMVKKDDGDWDRHYYGIINDINDIMMAIVIIMITPIIIWMMRATLAQSLETVSVGDQGGN